jgi:hypothetical protein
MVREDNSNDCDGDMGFDNLGGGRVDEESERDVCVTRQSGILAWWWWW